MAAPPPKLQLALTAQPTQAPVAKLPVRMRGLGKKTLRAAAASAESASFMSTFLKRPRIEDADTGYAGDGDDDGGDDIAR